MMQIDPTAAEMNQLSQKDLSTSADISAADAENVNPLLTDRRRMCAGQDGGRADCGQWAQSAFAANKREHKGEHEIMVCFY